MKVSQMIEISSFKDTYSNATYKIMDVWLENDPTRVVYQLFYNDCAITALDQFANSAEFIKFLVEKFNDVIDEINGQAALEYEDKLFKYQTKLHTVLIGENTQVNEELSDELDKFLQYKQFANITYEYDSGDRSVGISPSASWVIADFKNTALEKLLKNSKKLSKIKDFLDDRRVEATGSFVSADYGDENHHDMLKEIYKILCEE